MSIQYIGPNMSLIRSTPTPRRINWRTQVAPNKISIVRVTVKGRDIWVDWYVFKNHLTGKINKFSALRKANGIKPVKASQTLTIAFDKLGEANRIEIANRPKRVTRSIAVHSLEDPYSGDGVKELAYDQD